MLTYFSYSVILTYPLKAEVALSCAIGGKPGSNSYTFAVASVTLQYSRNRVCRYLFYTSNHLG